MTNSLVSQVEITVSCRNLMDQDIFSKSDPMVVLFTKSGSNKFTEFGRTETISNNLNPDFNKSFTLDYYFEEVQRLKFQVYDIDSASAVLNQHDFLGEFECNLGELVSRANVEGKLSGANVRKGGIVLHCTELGSCKEVFIMKFIGRGLDKKDFFGKSDPFLEICRSVQPIKYTGEAVSSNVQFSLAHRTEHIKNTLDPDWRSFQVRNWRLCSGDRDLLLRVNCYDWNRDGSDANDPSSRDFIGCCYTSVNDLDKHQGQQSFYKLINQKKAQKKKRYTDSGCLTLISFRTETEYTFVDYISGGTQLHFTVAVDFTASNGVQSDPGSLHFCHNRGGQRNVNQYELAITSVGTIIQDYDYDKMFPALGFGAKTPPGMQVSHCFPMTFQHNNAKCHRVEGLLSTYRQAVRSVTLFGPTNFAPCIRHTQAMAQNCEDGSHYFVLMIITDGIITDLDNTVSAIVDCSFLPMSIIIIGVGNDDFSTMDMLDCDNGLLRSGMKVADRDIVQFVPLRDYVKDKNNLSNQANLARAVLAELPEQVSLWMRKRGIKPKPPNPDQLAKFEDQPTTTLQQEPYIPPGPGYVSTNEQQGPYPPNVGYASPTYQDSYPSGPGYSSPSYQQGPYPPSGQGYASPNHQQAPYPPPGPGYASPYQQQAPYPPGPGYSSINQQHGPNPYSSSPSNSMSQYPYNREMQSTPNSQAQLHRGSLQYQPPNNQYNYASMGSRSASHDIHGAPPPYHN